jgi:hypothetical protein
VPGAPTEPEKITGQEPETFDQERAMATIRNLREFEKTAKAQRKELDDLRAKAKADDEAKLSEQERTNKRLKELEDAHSALLRTHTATVVGYEVKDAARDMKIIDPDAALTLLPAGAIEFDEAGQPIKASVRKALEALLKAKPYLAGQTEAPPGNRQGPKPASQTGETAEQHQKRMEQRFPALRR